MEKYITSFTDSFIDTISNQVNKLIETSRNAFKLCKRVSN